MRLYGGMCIFRRVPERLEGSSKKRQIGLALVQIGLPVIFFAGSTSEVGVLGRFAEAAAYALYTVGCVLFFVGCGGAFFEKERFYLRLSSAGVLFTVLLQSWAESSEDSVSHSPNGLCVWALLGRLENPVDDHRVQGRLPVGKHHALPFPQ